MANSMTAVSKSVTQAATLDDALDVAILGRGGDAKSTDSRPEQKESKRWMPKGDQE